MSGQLGLLTLHLICQLQCTAVHMLLSHNSLGRCTPLSSFTFPACCRICAHCCNRLQQWNAVCPSASRYRWCCSIGACRTNDGLITVVCVYWASTLWAVLIIWPKPTSWIMQRQKVKKEMGEREQHRVCGFRNRPAFYCGRIRCESVQVRVMPLHMMCKHLVATMGCTLAIEQAQFASGPLPDDMSFTTQPGRDCVSKQA